MFNSFWYHNLIKPPFTLDDSIFKPAWIILYTVIFISLIFYITSKNDDKKSGYIYFIIQLFLNFVWTPVFFGLKNISLALFVIILLDIFVLLTIKRFYCVSKIAGLLLVPYFLWICFATYLNIGYFVLN